MAAVISPNGRYSRSEDIPHLTRRQWMLVLDLAEGHDIATVAERRGRGLSSTYELAERVCDRLGLGRWQEIGPYAKSRKLDAIDGL